MMIMTTMMMTAITMMFMKIIMVLLHNGKFCLSGIPLSLATLAVRRPILFWNQDNHRAYNLHDSFMEDSRISRMAF